MCPCGRQNTEVVEHHSFLKISKLPPFKDGSPDKDAPLEGRECK